MNERMNARTFCVWTSGRADERKVATRQACLQNGAFNDHRMPAKAYFMRRNTIPTLLTNLTLTASALLHSCIPAARKLQTDIAFIHLLKFIAPLCFGYCGCVRECAAYMFAGIC